MKAQHLNQRLLRQKKCLLILFVTVVALALAAIIIPLGLQAHADLDNGDFTNQDSSAVSPVSNKTHLTGVVCTKDGEESRSVSNIIIQFRKDDVVIDEQTYAYYKIDLDPGEYTIRVIGSEKSEGKLLQRLITEKNLTVSGDEQKFDIQLTDEERTVQGKFVASNCSWSGAQVITIPQKINQQIVVPEDPTPQHGYIFLGYWEQGQEFPFIPEAHLFTHTVDDVAITANAAMLTKVIIYGQVVDKNYDPIEGVEVTFDQGEDKYTATTKEDGKYKFDKTKPFVAGTLSMVYNGNLIYSEELSEEDMSTNAFIDISAQIEFKKAHITTEEGKGGHIEELTEDDNSKTFGDTIDIDVTTETNFKTEGDKLYLYVGQKLAKTFIAIPDEGYELGSWNPESGTFENVDTINASFQVSTPPVPPSPVNPEQINANTAQGSPATGDNLPVAIISMIVLLAGLGCFGFNKKYNLF